MQSAEHLISQWPTRAWKRYRVLEGNQGPLVAEFLALRVVAVRDGLPGPEVWLLIRHKISGPEDVPEWKFYLSNAPTQTSLTALVRVIGMRWPIERCFADCKGELGLDHYELRAWQGWHHHQTLVLLAHHLLVRSLLRLEPREGGLLEAVPLPKRSTVLLLPAREQIPLSVAQMRLLLQVALPLPVLDIPATLALIAYQQHQKLAAYRSHRKRIMKRLMTLRW